MEVPLHVITRVPQNVQKVKQNNLNNITYIQVTEVKNHAFHIPQNLQNNELVTGNA